MVGSSLRFLVRLVGLLVMAVVALALVGVMLFFVLPRVLHWDVQVVMSGSMEPAMPVGSVVLVRPVGPEAVAVGDIITFRQQGSAGFVTHRVVEVVNEESLSFRTRGDANEEPDTSLVPADALRGRVWVTIPYLGYVAQHARQPWGFLLLVGVPGGLIIAGEVFHIFSTLRRGRQGKHRPQQVNQRSHRPRGLAAWLALGGIVALAVSPALLRTSAADHRCQERGATRPRSQARLWPPLCFVLLTVGLVGTGAGFWASGSYALFSDSETSSGNTLQAAPSFGPIPATVDIDPDALNPGSQGNFVTAYIELPEGWQVDEIDIHTVQLCLEEDCTNAEEHPTAVGGEDQDGIPDRMVKFSREAVVALLDGRTGDMTFRVRGEVSGSTFEGTDTIRVLDWQGDAEDSEPTLPEEGSGEAAAPPELPPPTPSMPTMEYEVQPGDTLWDIATRFGTTVEVLVRLNRLQNANLIPYGSVLNVPYVGEDAGGAPAGVSR
jgi:signal peptidase